MKASVRSRAVLCVGLLFALGCGAKSTEPDPNGESHWLAPCADDAQCAGSGSCLCGRCTVACQSESACGVVPVRTTCVVDAACGVSAGTCVPPPVDAGADVSVDGPSRDTGSPDVGIDAPPVDAGADVSADACVQPPCPAPGLFDPDTCSCVAVDAANPTGACVAPDDGARPGYPVVGAARWLPDCRSPLRREYWRVFAESAYSAYILPRPDGAKELTVPCRTADHPLASAVQRYKLCSAATTQADIDAVNHIDPATALAITHYLHAELLFVPGNSGGVFPEPIASDIVDADGGAVTAELADRLNELYGIVVESKPDGGCLDRAEHTNPTVGGGAQFATVRWPECVPTCSAPGPRWPYTADALPAGACEPATAPCAFGAQMRCDCDTMVAYGPVNDYHCACVDQRWECFIAVAGASTCACPTDAGAIDAARE